MNNSSEYSIEFIADTYNDLEKIDKSLYKIIFNRINKLKTNPFYGKHLGNKYGINLTGCYKIRVSFLRIVYTVVENKLIIYIVAIDKRSDVEVYKKAFERFKNILK